MRILITEWALDAYVEMVDRDFSREEYWEHLRPGIELLGEGLAHPRFSDSSFWGPAQFRPGVAVPDGFKMKWHNIGPGRIQLRLCVAIVEGAAWLCHAYSKTDPRLDYRMGIRLLDRIQTIRDGGAVVRGELHDQRA